jgi:hypothetical protein
MTDKPTNREPEIKIRIDRVYESSRIEIPKADRHTGKPFVETVYEFKVAAELGDLLKDNVIIKTNKAHLAAVIAPGWTGTCWLRSYESSGESAYILVSPTGRPRTSPATADKARRVTSDPDDRRTALQAASRFAEDRDEMFRLADECLDWLGSKV